MDLPYSLEAEQSVLGAVLVEPGCLSELVERLRPDSFYRPQHKALFNEMVRMFTSGEPVDFITLLEAAKEDEIFQSEQEAKIYLSRLMEIVPSVRNLGAYVDIILTNSSPETLSKFQAIFLITQGKAARKEKFFSIPRNRKSMISAREGTQEVLFQ